MRNFNFVVWFSLVEYKKFFYFVEDKSYLSEGRGLISPIVRVGRKEKLKFGRSQATSRLREVERM